MKMRVCSLCVGLAMLGLVVTVHADRDVKAHETGSATMVLVPGGTFRMGNVRADNEGSDSERPVHQVTLSPYWIGKYEVTYPLWVRVRDWAKANGYEFENEGREGYGQSQTTATPQANSIDEDAPAALASNTPTFSEQPVVMINWYDMVKWCNAYSQMQGLTPCYYTGSAFRTVYKTGRKDLTPQLVNWNANGYRLPTEAEWELAAKGGAAGAANPFTYAGGDNPDEVAWYKKNSGVATHFVGTKRPNQLGIHDMSGNVWEWCFDRYAPYGAAAQVDPRGPATGPSRVLRGGSCYYGGSDVLRSSRRNFIGYFPGIHFTIGDYVGGFRLVRSGR